MNDPEPNEAKRIIIRTAKLAVLFSGFVILPILTIVFVVAGLPLSFSASRSALISIAAWPFVFLCLLDPVKDGKL